MIWFKQESDYPIELNVGRTDKHVFYLRIKDFE